MQIGEGISEMGPPFGPWHPELSEMGPPFGPWHPELSNQYKLKLNRFYNIEL